MRNTLRKTQRQIRRVGLWAVPVLATTTLWALWPLPSSLSRFAEHAQVGLNREGVSAAEITAEELRVRRIHFDHELWVPFQLPVMEPEEATPRPPPPPVKPPLRLLAVHQGAGRRNAYLLDERENRIAEVRVGDQLDEFEVTAIETNQVVLQLGQEEWSLVFPKQEGGGAR